MYIHAYIIHIYIHTYTYIHTYIYIYTQVVGVDYSGRLIAAANEFQSKGYSVWGEGEEETTFNLPLEDVSTDNVVFKQVSSIDKLIIIN